MEVYLALFLTEFLDPVMNLPENDEGMKKMTDKWAQSAEKKRWYQVGCDGEIIEHVSQSKFTM